MAMTLNLALPRQACINAANVISVSFELSSNMQAIFGLILLDERFALDLSKYGTLPFNSVVSLT